VTRPQIPAAGVQPAARIIGMSEFLRAQGMHRKPAWGRDAATLIFDRFAGNWLIVEYLRNPGAVAFLAAGGRRLLRRQLYGALAPWRSPAALQKPGVVNALTRRIYGVEAHALRCPAPRKPWVVHCAAAVPAPRKPWATIHGRPRDACVPPWPPVRPKASHPSERVSAGAGIVED